MWSASARATSAVPRSCSAPPSIEIAIARLTTPVSAGNSAQPTATPSSTSTMRVADAPSTGGAGIRDAESARMPEGDGEGPQRRVVGARRRTTARARQPTADAMRERFNVGPIPHPPVGDRSQHPLRRTSQALRRGMVAQDAIGARDPVTVRRPIARRFHTLGGAVVINVPLHRPRVVASPTGMGLVRRAGLVAALAAAPLGPRLPLRAGLSRPRRLPAPQPPHDTPADLGLPFETTTVRSGDLTCRPGSSPPAAARPDPGRARPRLGVRSRPDAADGPCSSTPPASTA